MADAKSITPLWKNRPTYSLDHACRLWAFVFGSSQRSFQQQIDDPEPERWSDEYRLALETLRTSGAVKKQSREIAWTADHKEAHVKEFIEGPALAALFAQHGALGVIGFEGSEAASLVDTQYSTPLFDIQTAAIREFFSPRRQIDAKKPEVVGWINEKIEEAGLPPSNNIAEAIFTIIKPTDHDPRKRRG